jgi:hypothetical protein
MTSISWKRPVPVGQSGRMACEAPERLEDKPGIYFFSRRHGSGPYQPFYIGKSKQLRTRLEQYRCGQGSHETRIRSAIEGETDAYSGVTLSNGPRFFHFGYVVPGKGQRVERIMGRSERALIQYGLIVGWELINNHHAGEAATRRFDFLGSRYDRLLPVTLIAHK